MARDSELDRLFELKQAAYQEYASARQCMNEAYADSQHLQDRYGSEVDSLKQEQDDTYNRMKEAFADASRAFDCGDHENARTYADQGQDYKAELPDLVDRRRDLIGQLREAREKHKDLHREFVKARDAFHDAKNEYDRHKDIVQQAKADTLYMTDVPAEYQDDAVLRRNDDGSIDVFYGGMDNADRDGHGHDHYDAAGEKTYHRDPFDPHGAQNFTAQGERSERARQDRPVLDSQYHDGGVAAGLTKGGDRNWETPVHGTDADGNDVTVSFGRTGTDREGETLITDGHKTSDGFYGRDEQGDKLHDHSHGDGTYEDRGKYSGLRYLPARWPERCNPSDVQAIIILFWTRSIKMSEYYLDPYRSQFDLYGDVARALYALALDAVRSRNMERATLVCKSTVPLQFPMADIFGLDTPAFEIVECTNLDTIINFTNDIWDRNLKVLKNMQKTFMVVGLGALGIPVHYPHRSQYDLYRDLARALYALALDAVRARDMERATWICKSTMPLQFPMADIFDKVGSPAFEIVECTNLATILNFTDNIWDRNLKVLESMKDTFFEVLGD